MKQAILKFGGLGLAVFLLAGTSDVLAERLETASVSESDWEFELFIDGWLPERPAHKHFGELHQESWISLILFSNWKNSRFPRAIALKSYLEIERLNTACV